MRIVGTFFLFHAGILCGAGLLVEIASELPVGPSPVRAALAELRPALR